MSTAVLLLIIVAVVVTAIVFVRFSVRGTRDRRVRQRREGTRGRREDADRRFGDEP